MIRLTVPVVALAAVLLAVTGCGGSKKSSNSTAATTPATTTTSTSSSSTSSSSNTSTSESSGSGNTSTNESNSNSATNNTGTTSSSTIPKNCLNFASAAGKLGQALAGGSSPTENADTLKSYFNDLASNAPSDIKASFQTLAVAIGKYVDALKKANIKPGVQPSAADLPKLQAALSSIGTPEVQAASQKIQAWVKAGCHS